MIKIIENNKKIITNIIIILVFGFIITTCYCNSSTLNYDIIWLFHTSQKVSNGYTMYTEINTVLTPIFFWIGALFIKIFGNKILSMYILSGIVGGTIIATLYNILKIVSKKENNILFLICTIFALKFIYVLGLPNYNTLAIMWWLFAVFLELKNTEIENDNAKRKNNVLIGILIGLIIFTKQNIGIFATISVLGCSIIKKLLGKEEKCVKEIMLKSIGIGTVVLGMLAYFVLSNSLNSFIDYCIGGILEFENKNISFKLPLVYIGVIFLVFCGFAKSIRSKDKRMSILTITQIFLIPIIYPISNSYHILLSMIMLLPLLLKLVDDIKDKRVSELFIITFLFVITFVPLSNMNREYSVFEKIFMGTSMVGGEIITIAMFVAFILLISINIFNKENLSKYICGGSLAFVVFFNTIINVMAYKDLELPKNLYVYDGILYNKEVIKYIDDVVNYIEERRKNGEKVLVVSADASYYTSALQQNNYVYDFPLYGSLGFEGEERLIDNLPNGEDIVILKNKYMMYQESEKLDKYIRKNYKKVGEINGLEIFEK